MTSKSRINVHFIVCNVALIIIRMMKLKYSLSFEGITSQLNMCYYLNEEYNGVKILKSKRFSEFDSLEISITVDCASLDDFLELICNL